MIFTKLNTCAKIGYTYSKDLFGGVYEQISGEISCGSRCFRNRRFFAISGYADSYGHIYVTEVDMRLDKYLSESAVATRSEASKAARTGKITVNGEAVKSAAVHIDPESAVVYYCGKKVNWKPFTYVMLNKPQGVISSTDDSGRTVMDIIPPEFKKMGMFPCGRLDVDTTGLLLITNNGPLAHELLSPSRHVDKTYLYGCETPIGDKEVKKLEEGVDIGGHISAPAKVELLSANEGRITIREGKFHQIKRMFEAVGSKIVSLERVAFGPLTLDEKLEQGEWRYLTEDEEKELLSVNKIIK